MEAKRPFSQLDWLSTPEPVRAYIIHLEQIICQMQQRLELVEKRTEKLELRTKMNSQNSSKPPSSDYTHQHIELPKIKLDVTHLILHNGKCRCCGKTVKANIPSHLSSGYGARLSAVISANPYTKNCSCFATGPKNLQIKNSGPNFTLNFCCFLCSMKVPMTLPDNLRAP